MTPRRSPGWNAGKLAESQEIKASLTPAALIAKWRETALALTHEATEENKRRYLRNDERITYCRGKASALNFCALELEMAVGL